MRIIGKRMMIAVLVSGLAASAAWAQETDGDLHSEPPKPKAFWDGWFAPAAKPVEKKHDKIAAPPAGPTAADIALAMRKRELAVYSRRMEVCDRLMEVAIAKNDVAMQERIEQLKDRAWELYQQRTGATSISAASSSDEAVLSRKLSADSSSDPLTAASSNKAGTASQQASLKREVKP